MGKPTLFLSAEGAGTPALNLLPTQELSATSTYPSTSRISIFSTMYRPRPIRENLLAECLAALKVTDCENCATSLVNGEIGRLEHEAEVTVKLLQFMSEVPR